MAKHTFHRLASWIFTIALAARRRFASGFFYGLLMDEEPEEAVNLGWAHGALANHLPGRHNYGDRRSSAIFAKGGSARIQR